MIFETKPKLLSIGTIIILDETISIIVPSTKLVFSPLWMKLHNVQEEIEYS
jgi:hypothetical protein